MDVSAHTQPLLGTGMQGGKCKWLQVHKADKTEREKYLQGKGLTLTNLEKKLAINCHSQVQGHRNILNKPVKPAKLRLGSKQ